MVKWHLPKSVLNLLSFYLSSRYLVLFSFSGFALGGIVKAGTSIINIQSFPTQKNKQNKTTNSVPGILYLTFSS